MAPSREPTEAEILESTEAGDAIFNELLERVAAEDTPDDLAAFFSIWIGLTHLLAEYGWSPEELAAEAATHAAQQQCAGTA